MSHPSSVRPGPLRLTEDTRVAFRPALHGAITSGLWAERRQVNRDVSVPEAWDHLHHAGNFHNLELAAGLTTGDYVNDLPFLDSDIYKWLEAIGWVLADPELTEPAADRLRKFVDVSHQLLTKVQEDDGYLDSHIQVRFPDQKFEMLQWGHELYCIGHLIQGAVALHRTTCDARLLDLAIRAADLVTRSFGLKDGQIDGVCGHPEIETALVELYRETGDRSYLDTATYFIDRRGHGLLGSDSHGRHYWQDHLPIREAPTVEGHAVRQVYLLAGVADVYAETGDITLLEAAERQWNEMVTTKTYITGGIGAHHSDEAFGDPYELPNERSYCETCAAIGSINFSWRMLMITGEARYADLVERTLYNGFLGGLSLDGSKYIYANPLQVRDGHMAGGHNGDSDYERKPWFYCACCPPNVMRLLASLEHYVLLSSEDEVRVHQFIPGTYTAGVAGGEAVLSVTTDYPWDGEVRIGIEASPGGAWSLGVRVPHWADRVDAQVNGEPVSNQSEDGWMSVTREWSVGDELVVQLPLDVRFTHADPRVDADRGAIAIERGPLVYCLEAVDNPGQRLDDVSVDTSGRAVAERRADVLGGVTMISVDGARPARPQASWWPYRPRPSSGSANAGSSVDVPLLAVPYFVWGNRGRGSMRVWVPAIIA